MQSLRHQKYSLDSLQWAKWRLTFEGGDPFIQTYLKKFSHHEDNADFVARRDMSYCPAFAKEALVDIRNSIFQRMVEIRRTGSLEYVEACNNDVDGKGTTMTQFMGSNVLDELLTMGKVGIWVDRGAGDPYVYMYQVEDIYNWDDAGNPTSILLRDHEPDFDVDFGLSKKPIEVYRHARVVGSKVEVTFLDANKKQVGKVKVLDFDRIPFVILEIQESLLKDVANYQIALLNVASSDLSYVLRANFPFYTEQYDAKADMMNKFMPTVTADGTVIQETAKEKSNSVGVTRGKRYPLGVDRPGFISPPIEPLTASMAKQDQLKQEIRTLVNLSLSNMSPTRASRESKQQDEKGLEAGLSFLGQELEKAEKKIAYFWEQYLGSLEAPSVSYPKDYSLKSDEQRQSEAEADLILIDKLPSQAAKRSLAKKMMTTLFGGRLTAEELQVILDEIDDLDVVITNPETLFLDIENALVGNKLASSIRGYPAGEETRAAVDHAEKLSRIAIAQSEAAIIAGGTDPKTPGIDTGLTEKEKKDDVSDT